MLYGRGMDEDELWVEAYQGEVLGEALFATLAEHQADGERRQQLVVLAQLERATKELAEPVLARRGISSGDSAASVAAGQEMADAVKDMEWETFLGSFEPVTSRYLALYRDLAERATDPADRDVAEAYVAHEQALMAFARRARGEEAGEPLREILALPHVAAAAG